MKRIFVLPALFFAGHVSAQHADFENPALPSESAWYGQDQVTDGDTVYTSGNFNFEINYNSGWGTFAGWAVSNVTDNTTPDWSNQYSAITGAGYNGSGQYGICFVTNWEDNRIFTASGTQIIAGMYVTNTTYAYYTMLNGDAFAKPFGADTNAQGVIDGTNGEDWFLLTIYALGTDSLHTGDSVNFYLADYRFTSDADDYIVDQWTYVDLSVLGPVKGLDFVLSSTDTTGGFGMNNPSYFAMDLMTGAFASAETAELTEPVVYPNPTSGPVTIELMPGAQVMIHDMEGKLLYETRVDQAEMKLDLSEWNSGIYLLTAVCDGVLLQQRIVRY